MAHEQSDFLLLQQYAQSPDSSYCSRYTVTGMDYFSSNAAQLVAETSWTQNNFEYGDGDDDRQGIEERSIHPSFLQEDSICDFFLGGDIQDPSSIYNPTTTHHDYTVLSQDLLDIDPSTMSMINHVFPTTPLFESSIPSAHQHAFTPSTFSNHEPMYDSNVIVDLDGVTTSFSPKANSLSPSSILATKVYNIEPSNEEESGTGMITKRPRMEMPSPMPTFKVRKEKLGDRVTALQQLVSPFGKNDTASVLNEAAEYIKFLHNQVLSATNINNDRNPNQQHKINEDNRRSSLRSRGLCLVPISTTFTISSNDSSSHDYWTPTMFGGTFS